MKQYITNIEYIHVYISHKQSMIYDIYLLFKSENKLVIIKSILL